MEQLDFMLLSMGNVLDRVPAEVVWWALTKMIVVCDNKTIMVQEFSYGNSGV